MNRSLQTILLGTVLLVAGCRIERASTGRPGGFVPEPDSVASAEVYAALRGYYAALTSRDWRLVGTYFWPRATITTIRASDADSAETVHILTIEEFVAGAGRIRAASFLDEPVRASVVTYGDLADAWVTYRAAVGPARDSVVTRLGIDAFHLMRRDGRWRIAGLAFHHEVPGRPLAPRPSPRR